MVGATAAFFGRVRGSLPRPRLSEVRDRESTGRDRESPGRPRDSPVRLRESVDRPPAELVRGLPGRLSRESRLRSSRSRLGRSSREASERELRFVVGRLSRPSRPSRDLPEDADRPADFAGGADLPTDLPADALRAVELPGVAGLADDLAVDAGLPVGLPDEAFGLPLLRVPLEPPADPPGGVRAPEPRLLPVPPRLLRSFSAISGLLFMVRNNLGPPFPVALSEVCSAASYSPTPSPEQYHRR